ncbi:MAG: glyoxalase [Deltaproteobacteria bacterium]|nr:MAG: glyoxalase [Deltaproteobacteria bacterium]
MKTAARFILIVAVATALRAGAAEAPVSSVGAIGITVADLDRAAAFYADVLGFEKISETEVAGAAYEHLSGVFGMRARSAVLGLGDERIELTEYLAPRGRPVPADSRANDRWFQHIAIVTSDLARAYAQLREHRVEHASTGPQRLPDWNPSAGGIAAFYFRDPDEHFLELIQFPSGKGDPRWQRSRARGRKLFLGIDHTAIVVADTDASLAFYRDLLGLRVAGTSENWGTEQEHLNNVFGARLRITGLRAQRGPGIELLEYLAPRDGRPRPPDARANDLLHWQTDLVAPSALAPLAQRLFGAHAGFVSPGDVELPDGSLGFRHAMLVADPDGHALRVHDEREH